eukprot:SAG11_NODE_4315_length_1952_cov_2.052887_1_plen_373_part_00
MFLIGNPNLPIRTRSANKDTVMAEDMMDTQVTHIYEDYRREESSFNQRFTDKKHIKTFVTKSLHKKLFAEGGVAAASRGLSVKTPSFSQLLDESEVYKIILDYEDEAPTKVQMDEQTTNIVDWTQKEFANLLDVNAKDLAISTCSREVAGCFKVSVRIVVTTLKCVLQDQLKYLKQRGVVDSLPVPFKQGCIINETIYLPGHLTLPNCHNPSEPKTRIQKPITFVRNPMAHVPSCLMGMSGGHQRVKVKLVAPDESEDEDELEDEDEEQSDDSDVSEDYEGVRTSLNLTAEDVETLLSLVDPKPGPKPGPKPKTKASSHRVDTSLITVSTKDDPKEYHRQYMWLKNHPAATSCPPPGHDRRRIQFRSSIIDR